MSRRIVVDASVANSAGLGQHPTSQMCREFLLDMLTICHKIVLTKEIKVEWKNHTSKFSTSWLAAMRTKGKVITIQPSDETRASIQVNEIEGFTVNQIAAMEKDLLLLAAALETEGLIASCDEKARALFVQASKDLELIRGIIWVNPIKKTDLCHKWLQAGARHADEKTLGAPSPTSGS